MDHEFELTLTDQANHGADYLLVYVSEEGFDPTTEALGWDDLDLVKETGSYPTQSPYVTDVDLTGYDGRAVLFTVWEASHADQNYYLCSDINIGGPDLVPGDGGVDPTDPPVDPTDPPVDPTDPPVDPTDPPVDPTDPPVEPGSGCTAEVTRTTCRRPAPPPEHPSPHRRVPAVVTAGTLRAHPDLSTPSIDGHDLVDRSGCGYSGPAGRAPRLGVREPAPHETREAGRHDPDDVLGRCSHAHAVVGVRPPGVPLLSLERPPHA